MVKRNKHLYPSVHCGIVRAALCLLEKNRPQAAGQYSEDEKQMLTESAAEPDRRGDRHKGRGLHYYNAVSANGEAMPLHPILQGYCNGKGMPAPSPLTVLEGEYRTALALAFAGKRQPAMNSLTRAMHMLADICCPPHSCNLTYFSRYAPMHKQYEAEAAAMFWGSNPWKISESVCAADWAEKAAAEPVPYEKFTHLLRGGSPSEDGSWKGSRFAEICNALAETSARELEAVLSVEKAKRAESITRQITCAIRCCTALLNAFDHNLQVSAAHIWKEQQPYWLIQNPGKLSVTEEPLFLQFADDGTVQLRTSEGRFLALRKWGRLQLTDMTEHMITHFRFGREPLLTLYPEENQNSLLAFSGNKLYMIPRFGKWQNAFLARHTMFLLSEHPPKEQLFCLK
ncbi:MAG: hypothetical protein MJ071_05985 [Oscillospiraceae bacterium]|nr:hypothetical protein [Oscillospiraceae bacterium]